MAKALTRCRTAFQRAEKRRLRRAASRLRWCYLAFFLAGLAGAAAASSPRPADNQPLPVLVPRYSLQRKIEILIEERPIERALAWIKFKTGDV